MMVVQKKAPHASVFSTDAGLTNTARSFAMLACTTLPETVPSAKQIAQFAGVEYGGPQSTDKGILHYFREPITGTSICVWDTVLTLASLEAAAASARIRFGVA